MFVDKEEKEAQTQYIYTSSQKNNRNSRKISTDTDD